ncbi:uncharacterized protein EI90DRAFT_3114978 [Cantharellus anzutake]|uniref:uncharacterized protein n=1 Tax=Cantharellus anzutake TaxID=1750568 RepID=UPI001906F2A6|nr:uncharacterized protein EI90DRAFT_3114978 [Cantharellus anzutake]KAF8344222.1 hypothetical protein EI90DRAFT_3114978 [Cantharellus anzutake]
MSRQTGPRKDGKLKSCLKQPIPSGPSAKSEDGGNRDGSHETDDDETDSGSESSGDSGGEGSFSSDGTEDEITKTKASRLKSKQTLKRKRRALQASHFGQTLTDLLGTETPVPKRKRTDAGPALQTDTTAILSLQKPSSSHAVAQKLSKEETKTARALKLERKEAQDIRRITDKNLMEQWGQENERALRKIATRGVVKLFNIIQQAQRDDTGNGINIPAPQPHNHNSKFTQKKRAGKDRDEAGISNEARINKEDFLQSIRTGVVVSKS